jgi:putative restriction endonuclease
MSNYWWVNHKQTHQAEIDGGYIWSPKTEKNGARSQFYINLTLVSPGDIVFSYANAKIIAIGVAVSNYAEQSKPEEFGNKGENWANIGWIVPIEWRRLFQPFSPKVYIGDIAPLLPNGYSPINLSGNGNQKCYLAQISNGLADLLFSIISKQNITVKDQIDDLKKDIKSESELQELIKSNIEVTEKEQLTMARVGQGLFKKRLLELEKNVSNNRYI